MFFSFDLGSTDVGSLDINKRHKNVYFGKDSAARITSEYGNPEKVDTVKDLWIVAYAFLYDLKDKKLINKDDRLILPETKTVNGRFYVLYNLANKIHPQSIKDLKAMHSLALEYLSDEVDPVGYHAKIKMTAMKYLTIEEVNKIEEAVEQTTIRLIKLNQPY